MANERNQGQQQQNNPNQGGQPKQGQPKKDGKDRPQPEGTPVPKEKSEGPRLNLHGGLRAANDQRPFTTAGQAKAVTAFGDPLPELAGAGASLLSGEDP